jgi:hypothetical protein
LATYAAAFLQAVGVLRGRRRAPEVETAPKGAFRGALRSLGPHGSGVQEPLGGFMARSHPRWRHLVAPSPGGKQWNGLK